MNRKYLAIDGRGVISVQEGPIPPHKDGELLVEVNASLVSPGTELGGVKGRREKPNPKASPSMFGYQNAGVVIAKGNGCDRFKIGERVACLGGGFAPHATHGVCPVNLTFAVPDNLSDEEAAYNHLAATALHAIRRAQLQIGQTLVVVGSGIIGQISLQLGRLSGCRVVGLDRLPMRLELAKRLGAHLVVNTAEKDPVPIVKEFTEGYGVDAAIMAFGGDGTDAFLQLAKIMKTAPDTHQMGCIVIVGGCTVTARYAAAIGNVDVRSSSRPGPGYHDDAWEHGRDYPPVFVEWTTRRNVELCLRLISEGQLDVKSLTTHRTPLSKAPEACEDLIQHPDRALGVVILPKK